MTQRTKVTLEQRLIAASNRPSGFDYMRLVLAVLVVCTHSINVCYGKAFTQMVWSGPWRPLLAAILPMFFALSGFLVAGSLERCKTIVSFAGLRVIRLVPAITVDTVIGALLLGPFFTQLPLAEYFHDAQFRTYFLNIVGEIHYVLPGVFAHNPWPDRINQQLWTLPFELLCYVSLLALSFIGIAQRPRLFVATVLIGNLMFVLHDVHAHGFHRGMLMPGPALLLCFWYGIALYFFRTSVRWSVSLWLASVVLAGLCLTLPGGDYLLPAPIAYFTVYLGLLQPRRTPVVTTGDYSYGIFLYGFSVQQAVVAVLGTAGHVWYLNLLLALPFTILLAAFSWHCVEKPSLRLRRMLLDVEAAALRHAIRVPGGRFLIPALDIRSRAMVSARVE